MNRTVDAVHRRAREAARLEGRMEGSADARDAVLSELASSAAPEPLRSVLVRVLGELVVAHRGATGEELVGLLGVEHRTDAFEAAGPGGRDTREVAACERAIDTASISAAVDARPNSKPIRTA